MSHQASNYIGCPTNATDVNEPVRKRIDFLVNIRGNLAELELNLDGHILLVLVRSIWIDVHTLLVERKKPLFLLLTEHLGEATEVEIGRQHALLELETRLDHL